MARALTLSATVAAEPRAARYSSVAIAFHWATAVLLLAQVALGLRMGALHGSARFAVFQLHKSVGITILLLVVLRLAWRLYQHPPAAIGRGWEKTLATAVHPLFYLLLFALPVSGWIIISTSRIMVPTLLYGVLPWPHFPGTGALAMSAREAWNDAATFTHNNLVLLLYGLFALHVAGALKHQLIDGDRTIARMFPGVRPGAWADPRLLLIVLVAGSAVALGYWLPLGSVAKPISLSPVISAASVSSTPRPVPSTTSLPVANPAILPVPAITAAALASPAAVPDGDAAPTAPAAVPGWAILPGSTLHWRTTWSGDTIDGGFKRFDGDIVFDPEQLGRSHVTIRVDTASVFSGDAQRDSTLTTADWFATGSNPSATFTATRFRRIAAGRFIAAGTLTMKGATLPVPVSFALTIKDDTATMHGAATIDRTAFKIGEGEFSATTDIPAGVTLDIAVTAKRQ